MSQKHMLFPSSVSAFLSLRLLPISLIFLTFQPKPDSHDHLAAENWHAVLVQPFKFALISECVMQQTVGLCTSETDRQQNTSTITYTSSSSKQPDCYCSLWLPKRTLWPERLFTTEMAQRNMKRVLWFPLSTSLLQHL